MSNDGPILFLDIAGKLGWAYGRPGQVPRAGSVLLAKSGRSHGETGSAFLVWFTDLLKISDVAALYFEAPLDPRFLGPKTNLSTSRILLGLPFLLETIAHARSIYPVREVSIHDARKHFIGRSPRGDQGKKEVQTMCRSLRWDFADDNAADALCGWSFACKHRVPGSKNVMGEG